MPRQLIALALLAGCNYDYAFLGWRETTTEAETEDTQPPPLVAPATDTDAGQTTEGEVVLPPADTDSYTGDEGTSDDTDGATGIDTGDGGEVELDTDPPEDPLDTGALSDTGTVDSDPPVDTGVVPDTDPPRDTDTGEPPPPPPPVEPGCRVTVGVDGYTVTYEPGDTAYGEGYFAAVADSVGVTGSRAGWNDLTVTTSEGVGTFDLDSPAGWAWSSGCSGGVEWSAGRAVSLSDWAFIQESTLLFSPQVGVDLEIETEWAPTTSAIGIGMASTPGPVRSGTCGYGPSTPFLAIFNNGRYAGGSGIPRLELYVKRPGGATEILQDSTYPVPLPGSGIHELTLSAEGCE